MNFALTSDAIKLDLNLRKISIMSFLISVLVVLILQIESILFGSYF